MLEAFTQSWTQAWARELNESPAYRTAAATWEGPVALILDDPDPAARKAVVLDLWHGACRTAGVAAPETALSQVRFAFEGGRDAWRQVLSDGGSPALALMSGQIRLTKGSLAALLPFASAAQALLELAGRVPTAFPDGSKG
ncbi:MAG TPA: hypothetical protein VFU23_15100 [Gemmatimonadales bacterium]|nr:hypothetical protein [Gemmatimonadales bacterium]